MKSVQVGFSQRVQLDWLGKTAALYMAGADKHRITEALKEHLRDKLSIGSNPKRGTRDKAISILLGTWVTPPKEVRDFRDHGISLIQEVPASEHLAIHWGMTMAAYPFWCEVATAVGRLAKLQSQFTIAQMQARMREQYGERETVARAARRVLRAFVDWGVLKDGSVRGEYLPVPKQIVELPRLSGWLLEAVLKASNQPIGSVDALAKSPCLFPFSIPSTTIIEWSDRVELRRLPHGDLVAELRF